MVTQGQVPQKKRPVWQDIRPVKTPPKIVERVSTPEKSSRKKFSLPKISKKALIIIIVIILIASFATLVFLYIKQVSSSIQNFKNGEKSSPDGLTTVVEKATPEYSTITPANKDIDDIGGWTLVSRPGSEPFYRYSDKIGDTIINVSQQTLPKELKADTEKKIEQIAIDLKASETITIDGLIVHIKTSPEGQQYILFSKNGLLISITSDSIISNDQWIKYISSLQ